MKKPTQKHPWKQPLGLSVCRDSSGKAMMQLVQNWIKELWSREKNSSGLAGLAA
jgi:hypothetical protein